MAGHLTGHGWAGGRRRCLGEMKTEKEVEKGAELRISIHGDKACLFSDHGRNRLIIPSDSH